ncbi:SseB family protein [Streptomyces sp. AA8]|uniref:SseB family protein n=1 Tax=Streptomyces telluris TaxID=2720021 RepID=A0A9X2RK11_9ACTN|nr:SseB family protein [Streptomyces telluris]MCQ8769332.1 SseB family protein [Streptomyces telluris]
MTDEIRALHAEEGRPAALVGLFRRTAVLVPSDGQHREGGQGGQDGLWSVEYGGIRWICAFTDERALARFALAQGTAPRADGTTDWTYRTVLGARLLDVVVPAVGVPTGVALDVGSEHPMLFPPVVGIVPDAYAVDGAVDAAVDVAVNVAVGGPGAEGAA